MKKSLNNKIDHKTVFLGLGGAGKTTLINRLIYGDKGSIIATTPTLGVAIGLFEIVRRNKRFQILAADCGGQLGFARALWMPQVQSSDGVVFLFDSANPDSIDETKIWLVEVLNWIKTTSDKKDRPLLFLANKSDLEQAIPLSEIIRKLKLDDFINNSFGVYQISALKGTNVDDAFDWLLERVSKNVA